MTPGSWVDTRVTLLSNPRSCLLSTVWFKKNNKLRTFQVISSEIRVSGRREENYILANSSLFLSSPSQKRRQPLLWCHCTSGLNLSVLLPLSPALVCGLCSSVGLSLSVFHTHTHINVCVFCQMNFFSLSLILCLSFFLPLINPVCLFVLYLPPHTHTPSCLPNMSNILTPFLLTRWRSVHMPEFLSSRITVACVYIRLWLNCDWQQHETWVWDSHLHIRSALLRYWKHQLAIRETDRPTPSYF